ncbi:MAG: FHA domain-containing protein [Gemmataceae bacterium]|nr:FHA domain-containing protein [Gemmataceae bacterium]
MPTPSSNVTPNPPGETLRLESLDEIRQATGDFHLPTVRENIQVAAPPVPFRPTHRPPMAVLGILDDGAETGEEVRVRTDRFVLGRAEGNVVIPHDPMMSGRHAEISRTCEKGRWRWVLTDLGSTNGTFVRVSSVPLEHGQEVLLGGGRYRFDAAPHGPSLLAAVRPRDTTPWQGVMAADLLPSLVEVTPRGDGQRRLLPGEDNWIGRDPQCHVALPGDALLSARHARIHRAAGGDWLLTSAGSFNGCWVRIAKMPLDQSCCFQLGEQRFVLRILG